MKGGEEMKAEVRTMLQLARERRASDIQAAANARLFGRSTERSARQPIRRTLGRRIIAIGARVAAEPSIQPARSR
jgi:hypothetical protein